jgi:hypothetical protein
LKKLYREIERILRDAGFELTRDNPHAIFKSKDGKHGVSISRNIRDKNLANSLLRSAGIQARLPQMGELVFLDNLRQGRSVPVAPHVPLKHPEEKIRQAADTYMLDQIREWIECADSVTRDEPLMPADRAKVMRMLAIIKPEPRQ